MLLEGQTGNAVLADKAYDSNALRALIAGIGAEAVIPSNRTRKIIIPHDAGLYKHRTGSSAVSTVSSNFRRFATRYDRRTVHFTGFVCLAAAMIWLGCSHDLARMNVDRT